METRLVILSDELEAGAGDCCEDYDADCAFVEDKWTCFFYDTRQGRCPYLNLPTTAD